MRTLISQSIFGGKVDNSFDQKILESLINQYFRPESFNIDYPLFTTTGDDEVLKIPDIKSHKQFFDWIKALPPSESPAWSGLPNNVEKLVRERQAIELLSDFNLI